MSEAEQIEEQAARRPRARSPRPLLALLPFVTRYPLMLVAALTALIIATITLLLIPLSVRLIFDYGGAQAGALIGRYFLLLLLIAILLGIASALRFFFVTWLGERVTADVRRAVYDHITTLSPAFFETTRSGEVVSRLTADTTLIRTVVASSASVALRNLFTAIGAAIMLVYTSPPLSALALLILPAMLLPMILFGRRVRRLSRLSQDRIADTGAHAAETIAAMHIVQAFTHERADRQKYGQAVEQSFATARRRIIARAIMTAIAIVLVFAGVVGLLWVGAQYVLDGTMSGGTLGQFIIYAIFCAGALGALSEVWGEIQLAAGASERLVELLAAKPDIAAPARPQKLPHTPRGDICFDNISFSYPTRLHQKALNGFTLTIAAGETVALVGPSGAGKSTVFQLLMRFYDPQSGTIRFDNVPIAKAEPRIIRRAMALVPQETVIFGTSALENIRFGRPEASHADVVAAARAASADAFICGLAKGYDTQLGERGTQLSGGQRQRIAIARAILRDAPVLLLDEATSALDAESERLVQKAVDKLIAKRTTLVIAHRLATVQKADRIVVLDEGQICAIGTHDELRAQNGLYARLAALQFDRELTAQ